MSVHVQRPAPPLDQYIERLWYYVGLRPDHDREHVLPDGTFELIINLQDTPRKLFDRAYPNRHTAFKRSFVSGAHPEYLIIDALVGSSMIGVHFKPGRAAKFFGSPADEFTGRVVELDALWGKTASEWRDQLLEAKDAAAKLHLLHQLLVKKLAAASPKTLPSPGLRWALGQFSQAPHLQKIRNVSKDLGMSHKHFIELFRRQVGLTPKVFCRIQRFQQVLGKIQSSQRVDWAGLACDCGYFDQAHFVNDFVAFAGLNPSRYLFDRLEGDPNFVRAPQAGR